MFDIRKLMFGKFININTHSINTLIREGIYKKYNYKYIC